MKKIVFLKDILIEESPQVRNSYRHEIAEEYAEQYRQKKNTMPEPVLFYVDSLNGYVIGDGLHRINGMKIAGLKMGSFEVRKGSIEDAIKYALSSNDSHGMRRTNADKHQCAILAVLSFPKMSNNSLAELCHVGDGLIATARAELESGSKIEKTTKRVDKLGVQQSSSKTKSKTNEDKSKTPQAEPVLGAGEASSPRDATGYLVTDKALPVWQRRDEALAVVKQVRDLERLIMDRKKDILFQEVNFNSLEADFDRLHSALAVVVPHAVCPACQGVTPDKCKFCKSRAVVSKFKYERMPESIRKLREAAAKKAK